MRPCTYRSKGYNTQPPTMPTNHTQHPHTPDPPPTHLKAYTGRFHFPLHIKTKCWGSIILQTNFSPPAPFLPHRRPLATHRPQLPVHPPLPHPPRARRKKRENGTEASTQAEHLSDRVHGCSDTQTPLFFPGTVEPIVALNSHTGSSRMKPRDL